MNQTTAAPRPGLMPSVRLLIVEDDTSLATGLMRALSNEGYDVVAAVNGEEALERIRSEPYDLVVLDIGLPGIDGFEVLRRLRRRRNAVPVLMLTVRDEPNDRVTGLDL
ncbi:MAG TPA: response regulator, partial [Steroidobacteraceae bacterium]|nr:response regulator [Steroidobacteraceae bacterium]